MASNIFIKAIFQGADAERAAQTTSARIQSVMSGIGGIFPAAAGVLSVAGAFETLRRAIGTGEAYQQTIEKFAGISNTLRVSSDQLLDATREAAGEAPEDWELMEWSISAFARAARSGAVDLDKFTEAFERYLNMQGETNRKRVESPLEQLADTFTNTWKNNARVVAFNTNIILEYLKHFRAGLDGTMAYLRAYAEEYARVLGNMATAEGPAAFGGFGTDEEYTKFMLDLSSGRLKMGPEISDEMRAAAGEAQKFRDSLVAVGGDITFGWAGNLQRDLEDVREGFQLTFDLMEDNYDTTVKWTAAETALFDTMSGLAGLMSGRLAATLRTFKFTALDVIKSIGAAILDMIAQIAARLAASAIVAWLFAMFGMPFGANFTLLSGGLNQLWGGGGGGKTAPGGGGRSTGPSVMQVGEIRVSNTGWQDSWYESLAPRNARLEARGY
jgi:hypothetical protein